MLTLHSPRVTMAALIATVSSIAVAILPVVTALVGMKNPLSDLFGAPAAQKIVAAAQIIAALCAAAGVHVAAAGRSIVPSVDNPNPPDDAQPVAPHLSIVPQAEKPADPLSPAA